jgi:putative FmdB family regulatory protein
VPPRRSRSSSKGSDGVAEKVRRARAFFVAKSAGSPQKISRNRVLSADFIFLAKIEAEDELHPGGNSTLPLYPYECSKCGYRFEKIQSFSAEPLTECPKCKGALHRELTAPGLQFKGSGWYVSDYAGGHSAATVGSSTSSEASAPAAAAPATPCGGNCGAACPAAAAAAKSE